jgi:hypothetical protein
MVPETSPVKLKLPVDCPIVCCVDWDVVTWQGVPVEPPQLVVLAEWLLLVLDVAGNIAVRPGM